MRYWFAGAVLLAAIGTVHAQPLVTATVTGGRQDMKEVIVGIPMAGVDADEQSAFVVAVGGTDRALKHQYLKEGRLGTSDGKPELLVYIPELKADQVLTLHVRRRPQATAPQRLRWEKSGEDTIVLHDTDRPIAKFTRWDFDPNAVPKDKVLTNPTIKPYHHVFDAAGKTLLTNANEGRFPHHRGIFYGFNQISYQGKKADIWHCRNGESTRAGKDHVTEAGNLCGIHRLNVTWHGQDGQVFAREQRELEFFPMKDGLLVEFRSRMTTDIPEGVKLDGDPQHAGFHFRANAAVEATAKQTYFLRPDGKGEPGQERNWDPRSKKGPVNLPWNAMCFELDGKKRTVVYLDHPDNPKEARQSERTYGRIGTYFVYELRPDNPLFVKYRLWIQDGEMTVEQCEALSHAFAEQLNVEVK